MEDSRVADMTPDELVNAMCAIKNRPHDSEYAEELCRRAGILEEWRNTKDVERYQVVRQAGFKYGYLLV